jgi:cytochrome c oxidase assembly factor CtaG
VLVLGLGTFQVVTTKDSRRRRYAVFASLLLLVSVSWPLGDLAATVSLTAATLQRLLLMLAWAPLWLKSLSVPLVARLTRPALIDGVLRRLAHPVVAVLVVTVLGTLTLLTPVVDLAAHSTLARGGVVLLTALLGVVLWFPVEATIPGSRRLSPLGRAGYLFVSSLVVTSLSIIWIFARHPLYPALHDQQTILGISALLDQQLAGFLAKLGAFVPLWITAFVIFSRADRVGEAQESPLTWVDVERHFERSRRRRPPVEERPGG